MNVPNGKKFNVGSDLGPDVKDLQLDLQFARNDLRLDLRLAPKDLRLA